MFFVMAEISNYRQLSRLRPSDATDLHGLLEHFCVNRGGRLLREQNGFFLFSFHPLREKVLDQVSDFLFLTSESLLRKKDELFGFSLLLDQDDQADESGVFNRLKSLLFTAPRESRIWAGPGVLATLAKNFPVSDEQPLAEILGPPARSELEPLSVDLLLEMTGWIEALKTPLSRQLAANEGRPGKVLRLKGNHLTEKYFVLRTVLHQIYGAHDDFPVLFPLEDSRDFLSQLLARIDPKLVREAPEPEEPAWTTLLECRGGGDYPGDSGRVDVGDALRHYFRSLARKLVAQGLPPVFVFLSSHSYEPEAQGVLESVLATLVAEEGLRLLLLERADAPLDFLSRQPSLSWTFPGLSLERILRERDARGWQDRFPELSRTTLDFCSGRGMAWVHHLWALQEGLSPVDDSDPSWGLFSSLDPSHHKVYYILSASRGLLEESSLVEFFQQWGEDGAVIQDKIDNLRALGFLLGGLSRPLRPDFGPKLADRLGEEGRELLVALGKFLHRQWTRDHRLSEVLFGFLRDWGLHGLSLEVLSYYITNKINQGRGDFLPLLRPRLWETEASEEIRENLRLLAASAKLRYSLNLPVVTGFRPTLERFRRFFTRGTDAIAHDEWLLQQGRFYLRTGDLSTGFALLKRALLAAQDRDNRSLVVRAETEIGLALLRRNRIEEGREYFDIAFRLAEKTGAPYLVALTAGLDATAQFLLGSLTAADVALDRGLAAAHGGGLQKAKVSLEFLHARIQFDRGDYAEAQMALERASEVASRYGYAEAEPVLTAWAGRCEAYLGNGVRARRALEHLAPTAERNYFLAETFYFDRDLDTARIRIREAKDLVPITQPFGHGEQVSWDSGFAAAEDRALVAPGDVGVLQNQIEGFCLFLDGILDPGEAAKGFSSVLSRKALLELDPASAQFYFWAYQTVPTNDSRLEAHRLTLLGRALKDVQVRSSRIEDPVRRQEYLTKPRWNGLFAVEARKLKLL